MKPVRTLALLCATLLGLLPAVAMGQEPAKEAIDGVRQMLRIYEECLNDGDVETCVSMFTPDGVFSPPFQPAVSGDAELRDWYRRYAATMTANLKFEPLKFTAAGPGWVFVDVHTTGTTGPKATPTANTMDNKALFICRQAADGWKIVRYMVNNNQPATLVGQ